MILPTELDDSNTDGEEEDLMPKGQVHAIHGANDNLPVVVITKTEQVNIV